jgi:peptidoglycan hydrolase CwlO-like protein
MNDLLFTALIIGLLYYFFYYLPQSKISHQILTQNQSSQTELFIDPELKELKDQNQALKTKQEDYQSQIKAQETKLLEAQSQITKLQSEVKELVKRPLPPTNSKTSQTEPGLIEKQEQLLTNYQQQEQHLLKELDHKDQALTETNHQLETLTKENSANEKVLTQLLQEFQDLTEQLA